MWPGRLGIFRITVADSIIRDCFVDDFFVFREVSDS
jgi:hypothetical protein